MVMTPQTCMYCGCGNVPSSKDEEEIGPFLDLERDVNWGDSVYLCMNCVMKVAGLCGYISEDQWKDLEKKIDKLEKTNHDLKAELESQERRLRVVAAGNRTTRRLRKKEATA
jgi:hypothetical protein